MKKVTTSDLGLKFDTMPEEQRVFMEKMAATVCDIVNKASDGELTSEEIKSQFKSLSDKLADKEEFAALKADNEALSEQVSRLADNIEKMKQKGVGVDMLTKFDESIDTMFESEKFKSFAAGTHREARGFEIKDVSMTGNYSGTALITEPSNEVVSRATNKKLHVRDFATVLEGDPQYPMHAWQVIYDVNKNARYVSENGTLPESSFKVKEEQSGVKRVGTHIKMSKRMLASRVYVRSLIINLVIEAVLDAEDFGILFGDGSGDNLKGITSYDGVLPVEKIISEAVITGAGGSVTALEKYGKGVMLTLAAPNDLLIEGMRITLTSTVTSSKLSGTYDVVKANDTQLYIETPKLSEADITAEAGAVASLTYVVNNGAFKSVDSPNSVDALETGVAVMTFGQFTPTFIGLNPITINSIRSEKATNGNRLDVVKDMNGNPIIAGIRVTPMTSIPAGKYCLGDFNNGAEIIDYSGLTIDWADDVNTKLKNQVVLIAQEELIVPVKCPWAFAYGNISALKNAIAAD